MKKLIDLREYLLQRIPALAVNPDQLLTYVETGKIAFSTGANYSHQYSFNAVIIITQWRHSADDVVIPLLEWLNVREPGFDPEKSLSFEADILNKETVDLAFKLALTERVIVQDQNGERSITHVLPAPPLEMEQNANWRFFVNGPIGNYTVPQGATE